MKGALNTHAIILFIDFLKNILVFYLFVYDLSRTSTRRPCMTPCIYMLML